MWNTEHIELKLTGSLFYGYFAKKDLRSQGHSDFSGNTHEEAPDFIHRAGALPAQSSGSSQPISGRGGMWPSKVVKGNYSGGSDLEIPGPGYASRRTEGGILESAVEGGYLQNKWLFLNQMCHQQFIFNIFAWHCALGFYKLQKQWLKMVLIFLPKCFILCWLYLCSFL